MVAFSVLFVCLSPCLHKTTETHFDLSERFGGGPCRSRTLSLMDQVKTENKFRELFFSQFEDVMGVCLFIFAQLTRVNGKDSCFKS